MHIQRTITLILEQDSDLLETIKRFQDIQKELSPVCFGDGTALPLSALALHKSCYHSVVGRVSSQMTCSAIRLVAGAYVSARKNYQRRLKLEQKRKALCERKDWMYQEKIVKEPGVCEFRNPSALFLIGKKGRDAAFSKKDGKLSIWTVGGRKHLFYRVPKSQQHHFENAVEIDSLTVIERNGDLIGRLAVTLEVPDPKGILPVGVDLNETNMFVAVDVDDNVLFVSGKELKVRNKRTRQTRKRLQRKLSSRKAQNKDTRSLRRLLHRTSRRQRNRTKTFCQTAAKRLCQWAKPNSLLVFEDLDFQQPHKGLVRGKNLRRRMSLWQRGLIRECVANKAEEFGIALCEVDPAFTSQDCSRCGLRGKRKRHKFHCPHCGFECHADENAGRNIRNRFVVFRHDGAESTAPEALSKTRVVSDEGKFHSS
ncbi:MAG: Transposase, OrfB family [Chthonomonadaceae bacterium]|nr:Transposase, OrfB family [Chthonomonadaceae bacterium]